MIRIKPLRSTLMLLLFLAAWALAGCGTVGLSRKPATPAVPPSATAVVTAAAQQPAAPALRCPACKIIIDYSSLVAAGEDISKSAYGAWEAVLKGYESGAFRWEDIKGDVDLACKWADEMRAWTASMEKRIRELSLQSTSTKKKP